MEILNESFIPVNKKGSGIHIKKKNRGKFTEYCGGEVTLKCIDKAKKSKNPTLRKRATFADNARKWKHALGGTLVSKYQTGTKENGISLLNEVPNYLLSLTLDYQEPKPVDSFLGTDYVHNFIQKHKDVMGFDDEGYMIMGSPAFKIDQAYMKQTNEGSQIDGVTYTKLYNKQDGKNVSSNTKTLSMSTSTPVHFPNRKSYLKIYNELNGNNAQSYFAHNSYLPSIGNFILINRGHDFVEQLLEDRDDLYKERSQWIQDLSKPDWFKKGGTLIPKHETGTGKGGVQPSRNWDETLTGLLINYSENPDSIGWDPTTRRWYAPTLKGYDPDQFGMGVDRNKTPGFKERVKVDENGKEYLTEEDERYLRHMAIDAANESANARYKHALEVTGIKGSVSPKHDAITISAIYNLGPGFVANKLFENLPAMRALFDRTSSKYQQFVLKYYADKGRYERIKNENEFFKQKGL